MKAKKKLRNIMFSIYQKRNLKMNSYICIVMCHVHIAHSNNKKMRCTTFAALCSYAPIKRKFKNIFNTHKPKMRNRFGISFNHGSINSDFFPLT